MTGDDTVGVIVTGRVKQINESDQEGIAVGVAISGEVTVEYALRIKEELGADRTWVAAYANEVACYIPSEKVLAEGGYEAGWNPDHGTTVAGGSMIYYGWPTPFSPGLEGRIVTAVKSLLP